MTNGVLVDPRRIEDAWNQVLLYFTIGTQRFGRELVPNLGAIKELRESFMLSVDARIREKGFASTWGQEKGGGKYVLCRSSQIGVIAASLAEAAGASEINEDHVSEAILQVRLFALKVIERLERRQSANQENAEAGSNSSKSEETDSARLLIATPTAGILDSDGGHSTLTIRPPDPPSLNRPTYAAWCKALE